MTRSTRKWFRRCTFSRCSPHRQLIVSRRWWESNPLGTVDHRSSRCGFAPGRPSPRPSGSSVIHVTKQMSPPGVEPGLRPSQSRVHPPHSEDNQSSTPPRNRTSSCSFEGCRASGTLAGHHFDIPTWNRTRAWTFGESNAIRYNIGTNRADDWIRTSMIPLTRRTPFSVEPRRQSARA